MQNPTAATSTSKALAVVDILLTHIKKARIELEGVNDHLHTTFVMLRGAFPPYPPSESGNAKEPTPEIKDNDCLTALGQLRFEISRTSYLLDSLS